jgi:hypothetical protein
MYERFRGLARYTTESDRLPFNFRCLLCMARGSLLITFRSLETYQTLGGFLSNS